MPLHLPAEIKTAVDNALADHAPIMAGANDEHDQPYLSLRGSVHIHDNGRDADDQIAIWLRNIDGTTWHGVQHNPKIALFYRNPETRLSFQIQGRARIVQDDPALTKRVYDESAEPERRADAEMKGGAMLVDIDRVIQRNMVVIARDPAEVTGEFTVPAPPVAAPAR
jgi:hypothetical protein